jgi:hypothetical protein
VFRTPQFTRSTATTPAPSFSASTAVGHHRSVSVLSVDAYQERIRQFWPTLNRRERLQRRRKPSDDVPVHRDAPRPVYRAGRPRELAHPFEPEQPRSCRSYRYRNMLWQRVGVRRRLARRCCISGYVCAAMDMIFKHDGTLLQLRPMMRGSILLPFSTRRNQMLTRTEGARGFRCSTGGEAVTDDPLGRRKSPVVTQLPVIRRGAASIRCGHRQITYKNPEIPRPFRRSQLIQRNRHIETAVTAKAIAPGLCASRSSDDARWELELTPNRRPPPLHSK